MNDVEECFDTKLTNVSRKFKYFEKKQNQDIILEKELIDFIYQ